MLRYCQGVNTGRFRVDARQVRGILTGIYARNPTPGRIGRCSSTSHQQDGSGKGVPCKIAIIHKGPSMNFGEANFESHAPQLKTLKAGLRGTASSPED